MIVVAVLETAKFSRLRLTRRKLSGSRVAQIGKVPLELPPRSVVLSERSGARTGMARKLRVLFKWFIGSGLSLTRPSMCSSFFSARYRSRGNSFRILITGNNSGLVETITDAVSIHSIKKAEYARRLAGGRLGHVTLFDHFKTVGRFIHEVLALR